MPHLDDETLALLALGEDELTHEQSAHLEGCAACAARLADLRATAAVGRSALAVGELAMPGPHVWAGIERELGFTTPLQRPRRRRRRIVIAALATAAVVAGAAVVGLVVTAPPKVVASASLAGFPAWPGASGEASVTATPTGMVLQLRVDARSLPSQFREVWLISSDQKSLISLGVLHGSSGDFAMPKGVDIGRYDIVDVSSEPRDGNPAHSGNSIVRGALQPS